MKRALSAITLSVLAFWGIVTDLTWGRATSADVYSAEQDAWAQSLGPFWRSLGGDFDRAGSSPFKGPDPGLVRWSLETTGSVQGSITIGLDGRIHVGCTDGRLYTLTSAGQPLWTCDVNSPLLSSPTVGLDGGLYVGSQDGRLLAVSAEGRLRWTYQTGGPISSSPAIDTQGSVYVGSQDGHLYALRDGGVLLWIFKIPRSSRLAGSIMASPAIAKDGTLYIGDLYDPSLYALRPDGSLKWQCRFPEGTGLFASPVVGPDGVIYQTLLRDRHLYAVEPNDGSIRRCLDLADPNYPWPDYHCAVGSSTCGHADGWSEPAIGPDGTVYVSLDDPYLRAMSPDGSLKWSVRLGKVGGFTLTVASDGRVYAACDDGILYVVDSSGRLLGQYQAEVWSGCRSTSIERPDRCVSRVEMPSWISHPVIGPDGLVILSDGTDTQLYPWISKNLIRAIGNAPTEGGSR